MTETMRNGLMHLSPGEGISVATVSLLLKIIYAALPATFRQERLNIAIFLAVPDNEFHVLVAAQPSCILILGLVLDAIAINRHKDISIPQSVLAS